MGYLVNWLPRAPATRPRPLLVPAVEEQFYLVWPAVVFFSSSKTLWRATVAIIVMDIAFRFGVSMWSPGFVTPQLKDLATFARADTLAVGALLAQRERNGGWGREMSWSLPACLAAGVVVIVIRRLEQLEVLSVLTYNLKWPMIALGSGVGCCSC